MTQTTHHMRQLYCNVPNARTADNLSRYGAEIDGSGTYGR